MRNYFIYIMLILVGYSCSKDEIDVFDESPMAEFNLGELRLTRDTLDCYFGFTKDEEKHIELPISIIGYAEDRDRVIKYRTESSSESWKSVIVFQEDWTILKNEVELVIPIKILRKTDVIGSGVEVKLHIEENENFKVGMKDSIVVRVSDEIPSEWIGDERWFMYKVEDFFGPCTSAKYRFVFETLGIWDFSSWNLMGMMGDQNKFNPALRILKNELAEVGPIVDPDDETGYVTFPE